MAVGIQIDEAKSLASIDRIQQRIKQFAAGLRQEYTVTIRLPTTPHPIALEGLRKDRRGRYRSRRSGRFRRAPISIADVFSIFVHGSETQPARNVLVLNRHARERCLFAMRRVVASSFTSNRNPNWGSVRFAGAQAIKSTVVRRMENSGDDVRLARLSAAWAATKRRRGWDARIGVATGTVLRAIKSAPVILTPRAAT